MERADERGAKCRCRAHRHLTARIDRAMMQDSWQILRDNDKQLALCLLFAPKNDRRLLADIFCLANELENAVRIPSEIMLAAIRLQWWHDALADKETPPDVPLMQALQAHIAAMRISRDDLLALVALWQTRINDSEVSPTFCFAGCWQLAAKVTCGADFGDIAARIADQFAQNETGTHRFKAGDLGTLKRGSGAARWLYLAGCLANRQADAASGDEDPLLIWRLLFWRFGIGGG